MLIFNSSTNFPQCTQLYELCRRQRIAVEWGLQILIAEMGFYRCNCVAIAVDNFP